MSATTTETPIYLTGTMESSKPSKPHTILSELWRYQIGFHSHLATEVRNLISNHPHQAERSILSEIFDWHDRFISLDALITALNCKDISREAVIDQIDEPKILHIPRILIPYFERSINALPSYITETDKRYLYHLVDVGLKQSFAMDPRSLYKIIFGDRLDELIQRGKKSRYLPKYSDPDPDRPSLSHETIFTFAEAYLRQLAQDPNVLAEFGDCKKLLTEIDYELRSGNRSAEMWPRELLASTQRDRVVIYSVDIMFHPTVLEAYLIHEVIPGHVYFYNQARLCQPSFLDYGAASFIEGWATWCEWHVYRTPGALRDRADRVSNIDRRLRSPYPRPLKHGRGGRRARRPGRPTGVEEASIVDVWQYPGFGPAYELGSLWFEELLSSQRPADFWEEMATRSWGDFFRVWNL